MVFRSILSLSCEAVPLRAFFEDYFCKKESEMLNILIKAMYGDPEAIESWEEHCFWRDEEFRRSDELKRITHLLGTIFDAKVPAEGIYNKKGKLISDDVLENGDKVKIYGDGIMLKSFPGQYPGVTKIQRTGRASLEETQEYEDLVNGMMKPVAVQ